MSIKNMYRWGRGIVILLFVFQGCWSYYESPVGVEDAFNFMNQSSRRIRTIRAKAVFLEKMSRGIFRGSSYVFFKAPRDMRIDIVGSFDNLLTIFLQDSRNAYLIDYVSGEGIVADTGGCLFSEFFGLDFAIIELVDIFLGNPPMINYRKSKISYYQKGYYILQLENEHSGLKEELQFVMSRFGPWVVRAVISADGKKLADIIFHRRVGAKMKGSIYSGFEAGFPPHGIYLKFRYEKVAINTVLPDDVFNVGIPAGFVVKRVKCQD